MAKFPTTLILFEITSTTIDAANLEIQKSDRIVTLLNSNLSGKMQGKYMICWFMLVQQLFPPVIQHQVMVVLQKLLKPFGNSGVDF